MIGFVAVTVIVYFLCYSAFIKEEQWNKEHSIVTKAGDAFAVDLLVFLIIAELPMLVIIFLALNNSDAPLWDLFVGSGFMLACSLFLIGNGVKWFYSALRKSVLSKMNFRDFEKEMTFVFLLVCLIYMATLVRLRAWKVAFSFAAIVIGRFVWFDSTIKSIKEEFIEKYSEITCCPIGSVCIFICISATACISNEIYVMAALLGAVIAFVKFEMSQRKKLCNSKSVLLVILILTIIIFVYFSNGVFAQISHIVGSNNLKTVCVILICGYFIFEMRSLLFNMKHWVFRWLKNWSVIFWVILITLAIPIGAHFKFFSDKPFAQETLLSAYTEYLSFLGAFALGYYLYKREEIRNFEALKKKARMIYESMQYITINFENIDFFIERGEIYPIPENWRSDYLDIKHLVKYEESALGSELQYFYGRVDSINKAIVAGNKERAQKLYLTFVQKEQYSTSEYNYMNAAEVMLLISLDMPQHKIWKKTEKEQIKKYADAFFDVVNLRVYNYLIKNHLSSCDLDDIEYELVDWLLQNPELNAWVKHPYDKRKISAVVFLIALSMNKKSPNLNYYWREFSFKRFT